MDNKKSQNTGRKPNITIENEARFIAMRLAKSGYYQGNPEKILKAPIDIIMNILEYEKYENDLIDAYEDIRKEDS